MNRVLVTGGAGFIGSHIVQKLLDDGCKVRVLDDLSSGKRANIPINHERLEFIEGSIVDKQLLERACLDIDAVIHLAALVSVPLSISSPDKSAATNVTGFLNVLNCLKEREFQGRFIYASSSAVYGSDAAEKPLTEECAPGELISPYALDKYTNERYAELYAKLYGMKTLGFRFFNIYGPRQDPSSQYSGVISIFMDSAINGKKIGVYGDGFQTRDFVYVGDLAKIVCEALIGSYQGVLNLGTGNAISVNELVQAVKTVVGSNVAVAHLPPRKGDIKHSCANTDKLREALGLVASSKLEKGLRLLFESALE